MKLPQRYLSSKWAGLKSPGSLSCRNARRLGLVGTVNQSSLVDRRPHRPLARGLRAARVRVLTNQVEVHSPL